MNVTEALNEFAPIAKAILAEAPATADYYSIFLDCDGVSHRISMDALRGLAAGEAVQPVAYMEMDDGTPVIYLPNTDKVFEHIRDYPHLHTSGPVPLYAHPSPASAGVVGEGITISQDEVKALLYGVPKFEFSQALTRLAAWLAEVDDTAPTQTSTAAPADGGKTE